MSVVFLDRDGVINECLPGDYVTSLSDFRFLPGALQSIRHLTMAGWRIVVVTNQSAVGRGLIDEADLLDLHRHMLRQVEDHGGLVEAIYYCPHLPEEGCDCRKPAPGMILRAVRELDIDLESSWLIGDNHTDIAAAHAAGCRRTILIPNRRVVEADPKAAHSEVRPLVMALGLADAVDFLTRLPVTREGELEPSPRVALV